MILDRLRREGRFAGSRLAPAGCEIFDTPGSHTFTWPAGVTRAIVHCRGADGGASAGTNTRGGSGAGGGADSERIVLKTDATASVSVGSKGVGGVTSNQSGTDGGDSSFIQSSSIVEYCSAAGGKGAVGPAGGAGGLASDSYGTIKYSGGNGGVSGNGDGGGGGGARACATSDGEDGLDDAGTDQGGEGGAACPITGNNSTGGGRGGNDGAAGSNGTLGGGGGGGTRNGADTPGGDGNHGEVSICWEDPVPDYYCVDDGGRRAWWPRCNYYCNGLRCFYYGSYFAVGAVACAECPGGLIARCWQFSISGIGGTPSNCANMNGTWIIEAQAVVDFDYVCTFQGASVDGIDGFSCINGGATHWKFGRLDAGAGNWFLSFDPDGGGGEVWYSIPHEEFQCLGRNTLSLHGKNCCTGYPLQIKMTPVNC